MDPTKEFNITPGDYSPPEGQSEMIDIAQTLEQLGRDTSLAEQERKELLAIERALAKMTEGRFGICEECAEEIPAKRLQAVPEARLCAKCQAFEERRVSRTNTSKGSRRAALIPPLSHSPGKTGTEGD